MKRFVWVKACLAIMCIAGAGGAWAAPADDHQRALLAYDRGDVAGAMVALRAPAKAGYAPSQVLLAFILDRADFPEDAAKLYAEAAAQGHAEGHAGLANAYQTGRGIAKDEKLAVQHFSKAAELGHPLSIEVVADLYIKGRLGLTDAPADQALAAVRRAAGQDHLASIEALSQAHRNGRWGLPVDPQQAAVWQARAAALVARRKAPASAPAVKGRS